jgi:hypothetical protein
MRDGFFGDIGGESADAVWGELRRERMLQVDANAAFGAYSDPEKPATFGITGSFHADSAASSNAHARPLQSKEAEG